MFKQLAKVALATAGILSAPAVIADSVMDIDPYWQVAKIELTAANDSRTQPTTQGTGSDAVNNPGNYYY